MAITEKWLPDSLMQAIATENNLAETAFVVPEGTKYGIRWFTPSVEVELCGHATLASAYALCHTGHTRDAIEFASASGILKVAREDDRFALDFPSRHAQKIDLSQKIIEALGARPQEVHQAQAMMAVFETEEEIRALRPRLDLIAQQPGYGLVVTAPGKESDFVSRFFAPQVGVAEDPVTGSTHCILTPYWSARIQKRRLYARQLSARGGELWCEDRAERVTISGHCVLYLKGEIEV